MAFGVLVKDGVVAAHASVVVDVTWLGGSDDGVKEKLSTVTLGGDLGQLDVGEVHGVAGLEGNDLVPLVVFEELADFGRRPTKIFIILVLWHAEDFDASTGVELVDIVIDVDDLAVVGVASVHLLALDLLVGSPDFVDMDDATGSSLRIRNQDLSVIRLEVRLGLGVDVEHNGDRPELAVCEAEVSTDALVVGSLHESTERSEGSVGDKLEVTELTPCSDDLGVVNVGVDHGLDLKGACGERTRANDTPHPSHAAEHLWS